MVSPRTGAAAWPSGVSSVIGGYVGSGIGSTVRSSALALRPTARGAAGSGREQPATTSDVPSAAAPSHVLRPTLMPFHHSHLSSRRSMFCASRRRSPAQARPYSHSVRDLLEATHYTLYQHDLSLLDRRRTRNSREVAPFLTLARPDLALASAREDAIAGAERGPRQSAVVGVLELVHERRRAGPFTPTCGSVDDPRHHDYALTHISSIGLAPTTLARWWCGR